MVFLSVQSLMFIETAVSILKVLALSLRLHKDFLYLAVSGNYLHMYGGGPVHGWAITQEKQYLSLCLLVQFLQCWIPLWLYFYMQWNLSRGLPIFIYHISAHSSHSDKCLYYCFTFSWSSSWSGHTSNVSAHSCYHCDGVFLEDSPVPDFSGLWLLSKECTFGESPYQSWVRAFLSPPPCMSNSFWLWPRWGLPPSYV